MTIVPRSIIFDILLKGTKDHQDAIIWGTNTDQHRRIKSITMGAELSTLDETTSEQTSTRSRNSTRSASRRDIFKRSRAVLELVKRLEVKPEFYDCPEKKCDADEEGEGIVVDTEVKVDEKELKSKEASVYVRPHSAPVFSCLILASSFTQRT